MRRETCDNKTAAVKRCHINAYRKNTLWIFNALSFALKLRREGRLHVNLNPSSWCDANTYLLKKERMGLCSLSCWVYDRRRRRPCNVERAPRATKLEALCLRCALSFYCKPYVVYVRPTTEKSAAAASAGLVHRRRYLRRSFFDASQLLFI